MNSLISVIIPVYDVEAYLKECIQSVIDQTYENLEIILVDDGSTDASGNICDDYAKKDKRIKVIHKLNGGLSDARNVGLDMCKGDYISFIDSDDIVNTHYIEYLYTNIVKNKSDIASTNLYSFKNFANVKVDDKYNSATYATIETVKKMLNVVEISSCACAKLYKRELFEEIRFPVGRLYEDYLTIYRILAMTQTVTLLDNKMYYYRQREGSIMRYVCSEKTVTLVDAAEEVCNFILNTWPKLDVEAYSDEVTQCLKCLQKILNYDQNSFLTYQNKIHSIVSSRKKELLLSKRVCMKLKIKVIAYLLGKKFFINIYNYFDGSKKYEG